MEKDIVNKNIFKEQEDTLFERLGPRLWSILTWCEFYLRRDKMFRITIYDQANVKSVDEYEDREDMREVAELCITEVEDGLLKSFTVSRIKNPFGGGRNGS